MEKAMETRLELLKSGVKPELIMDTSTASGKVSKTTSKTGSPLSKQDLESYQVSKLLENRE